MQRVATGPTHKQVAGAAVVAGLIPAAATGLRGMPGVNPSHRTAALLSLVRDKALQLGERPAVDAAAGRGLAPDLRARTNVPQVLQHNCCAGQRGLHDLLRENVVTIAPEAGLFAPQPPQVSLGRLRAPLLQGPLQLEVPAFACFPGPLAQKAVVRRDGGAGQAQVYPHHRIGRLNHRLRQRDDDVQPPLPFALEQVGGVYLPAHVLLFGYAMDIPEFVYAAGNV